MVETPSSSDPGPDQNAAQPTSETQPAAQPPTSAAASPDAPESASGAGTVSDTDTETGTGTEDIVAEAEAGSETVTEAVTEVVSEVVSTTGETIETVIEEVSTTVSDTVVAATSPAAAPPDVPSIAATLEVPPLDAAAPAGEGGEWELLVGKVNAWFASGELQSRWQKIRGPLKGVAILIAVVLALRVYASLVGTIDSIPVVSGLLELTGLIALVRFALTKLVKTSEREKVLSDWKRRWDDFRGGA